MTAKSANEIDGFEFDWLASDADGFVALFSTAGGGYAPESFINDTDRHDTAIVDLLAVPALTRARFSPDLQPELQNTWKLVAERGVFAFDSDAHGGPYRLVAMPERPAHISSLPMAVQLVASSLAFPSLRFVDLTEIPGQLLGKNAD